MCVVSTLNVYIEKTKKWRNDNQTQLFLSFIKSHKEVVSSTIAGWIKNIF